MNEKFLISCYYLKVLKIYNIDMIFKVIKVQIC